MNDVMLWLSITSIIIEIVFFLLKNTKEKRRTMVIMKLNIGTMKFLENRQLASIKSNYDLLKCLYTLITIIVIWAMLVYFL